MFSKNSWICGGNYNLPYKTLIFKVSIFSLMFAFSRFLAQNANILVKPVLNLRRFSQNKCSGKKLYFWWKSLFPVQNAKMLSLVDIVKDCFFAIFWCKMQPLQSNQFWISKTVGQNKCFWRKVGFVVEIRFPYRTLKFKVWVYCLYLQLWKYCHAVFQ